MNYALNNPSPEDKKTAIIMFVLLLIFAFCIRCGKPRDLTGAVLTSDSTCVKDSIEYKLTDEERSRYATGFMEEGDTLD